MRNYLSTFFILCLFFSCSKKPQHITDNLIGTWVLDSELYVRGGLQKISGENRALRFYDNESYSYHFQKDDILGRSYGRYFILENPNRKRYTLSFIPDITKDKYMEYMNYDIISVSDSFLKLAEPTKVIMKDDKSASFLFNGQLIYKRHSN